jgi:hypothetical protein
MGNTQVHERRTCEKFPVPLIAKNHMVSCVKPEDREIIEKACNKQTKKEDGSDTSTSTATAGDTKNLPNTTPSSTVSVSVFKRIKNTIHDILDPPEPERLPPKRYAPKQMLYGCSTVEEHYAYIEKICQKVAGLKGKEGLEAMGFEFRLVHLKNCNCPGHLILQNHNNNDDDDLTDSEADPDELKDGYMEESDDDNHDEIGDAADEYGQYQEESSDEGGGPKEESYMIPIKQSSEELTEEKTSIAAGSITATSSVISRNTSTLSLFSLATHNTETDFSNPTTGTGGHSFGIDDNRRRNRPASQHRTTRFPLATISSQPAVAVMEQDTCAYRLHHVPSGGTLLTNENHLKFVPDGDFYDELSRACMEYSQQVMMEEGDLEWMDVSQEGKYGALVSRSYLQKRRQPPTTTATTNNNDSDTRNNNNNTLVIVTGKGQVQAGIFSRRHLLVTSMEAATALPFVRGAKERGMDMIIVDPNALGYRMGMDVVETTLKYLLMDEGIQGEAAGKDHIYVLAHSMAGAQIVRFFSSSPSSHSRPSTPMSSASGGPTNNSSTVPANSTATNDAQRREALLKRVEALAFTDSNHNINWTKNHPYLTQVLTGPPSLYIKSHKVHEKAKTLGEKHHDCQFWRHRFGPIKTLWAGTHEHALTNYTARAHVWEHFDSSLKDRQLQLQHH